MKLSKRSAALSVCLLMSGTVTADTFVMRDGRSIAGEFLGSTARSAHLRTANGVERFPLTDVQTIRLDRRPETSKRDVSARSTDAAPRAVIVGMGQAQSIERVHSTN